MFGLGRSNGTNDVGENSNDECCMCGEDWHEGETGWVLCDTEDCENTVCQQCTNLLSLSVSELFYCPLCAGKGNSAAATAGAAVVSAVAACSELLEKLPLSFKATHKILSNLLKSPEEARYRKLRITENKKVKELIDYEPVLNILTTVGFVRKQCAREQKNVDETTTPTEEVLILEGEVPILQIQDLLNIFEGLTPQPQNNQLSESKRKADDEKLDENKKHRK
jgi:hypothetical protein